jgi:hypothetical protein
MGGRALSVGGDRNHGVDALFSVADLPRRRPGSSLLFSLVMSVRGDVIATVENKESSYWAGMKTIARVSTTTADGDQHSGGLSAKTDVTDNRLQ